jgi:DNA-binding phage protein
VSISLDIDRMPRALRFAPTLGPPSWIEILMSRLNKNAPNNILDHLNRVLNRDDPMTFQKVLLDIAHNHHGLALVAKQVGVRRETIWRYRTGDSPAPFEILVKIIAMIGAKLVIVADEVL